ncbi:hypothetical protein niasHS_002919 [Heterodera schachtii]|uniref:Uncharacterized protein n=1 Tax=Heterodera schachtii TaxID=97005 RepID=A0ABD2K973_HETSC
MYDDDDATTTTTAAADVSVWARRAEATLLGANVWNILCPSSSSHQQQQQQQYSREWWKFPERPIHIDHVALQQQQQQLMDGKNAEIKKKINLLKDTY